ncbi:MAG TPA: sugar transferase [Gaiellaceae bacterium]|nr:sugar transferase [Gaiellaceae bacterium]
MPKLAAVDPAPPAAVTPATGSTPAVPPLAPKVPRLRALAAVIAVPLGAALLTGASITAAVAAGFVAGVVTAVLLALVDGFTPNAYASAAAFARAVCGVALVGCAAVIALEIRFPGLGGAALAAAVPAGALLGGMVLASSALIPGCRNRPVRAIVLGHAGESPLDPYAEHLSAAVVVLDRIVLPDPTARIADRIALQRPDVVLVEAPVAELDFGVLRMCSEYAIRVLVLVRPPYALATGHAIVRLGGLPWVQFAPFAVSPRHLRAKRALDLLLVIVGSVLFAPMVALVGLVVACTSQGGALYRQRRVGAGGRVFWVYKFRTMCADAERETGPVLASEADPRVTAIGRVLRRFRIDELPQLWNVLRGDMSLVGPRPERPELVQQFAEVPEYAHRHLLRPGITGLAQLVGGYSSGPVDKLRCDLLYLSGRSLRLDLRLIGSTLLLFLRGFPVD